MVTDRSAPPSKKTLAKVVAPWTGPTGKARLRYPDACLPFPFSYVVESIAMVVVMMDFTHPVGVLPMVANPLN